jgi:hypothetical protein
MNIYIYIFKIVRAQIQTNKYVKKHTKYISVNKYINTYINKSVNV